MTPPVSYRDKTQRYIPRPSYRPLVQKPSVSQSSIRLPTQEHYNCPRCEEKLSANNYY